MLDKEKILAKYRENYELAIDEGRMETAAEVAWEWTEAVLMREFQRIKENHHWGHVEAVNKVFFG